MKVEALTTASSAPDAKMPFNFRVGDKFDVTPEVYEVLHKAGAVRSLEPAPPAKIETGKGGKKGASAESQSAESQSSADADAGNKTAE